ncbi:MAG: hypothetical protein WDN06_08505 [Asticcacaulis sp.]
MLLLSLGPDLLAALLNGSAPRDFNGPRPVLAAVRARSERLARRAADISEQIQAAE